MKKTYLINKRLHGFSLLEILFALSLLGVFTTVSLSIIGTLENAILRTQNSQFQHSSLAWLRELALNNAHNLTKHPPQIELNNQPITLATQFQQNCETQAQDLFDVNYQPDQKLSQWMAAQKFCLLAGPIESLQLANLQLDYRRLYLIAPGSKSKWDLPFPYFDLHNNLHISPADRVIGLQDSLHLKNALDQSISQVDKLAETIVNVANLRFALDLRQNLSRYYFADDEVLSACPGQCNSNQAILDTNGPFVPSCKQEHKLEQQNLALLGISPQATIDSFAHPIKFINSPSEEPLLVPINMPCMHDPELRALPYNAAIWLELPTSSLKPEKNIYAQLLYIQL